MSIKVNIFGQVPTLNEIKQKLNRGEMPEDNSKHFFPGWQYLAGILDGEGCIGIVAQKKEQGYRNPRFRLRVSITSKNRAFLDRLKTIYGGFVTLKQKKHPERCQHLMFWDDKAGWVLWNTFQYLILKREEAKVAFQFLIHKHSYHAGRDGLSEDVLKLRWKFKNLLSSMKGRASKLNGGVK